MHPSAATMLLFFVMCGNEVFLLLQSLPVRGFTRAKGSLASEDVLGLALFKVFSLFLRIMGEETFGRWLSNELSCNDRLLGILRFAFCPLLGGAFFSLFGGVGDIGP